MRERFCPFCCTEHGYRQSCEENCRMWVSGDCVIKSWFCKSAGIESRWDEE